LLGICVSLSAICAQDASTEAYAITGGEIENQAYDWSVKVVWLDRHGKKQRSKGRLLIAHDNGIMIREVQSSGRSVSHTIDCRSIIKLKYSRGEDPFRNVISGAANGLGSSGPIPISTGNVYFDLLAGALSGALASMVTNSGSQTVVWVNRDSRVYREKVLPDLGFVSTFGVD
jgi:hypothetical protein